MIFRIAAIVLFILVAVFAFLVDDVDLMTNIGLLAAGLACLAAEPFDTVFRR
jgi:hypothetical protein